MPPQLADELIAAALHRIESFRKPICSTYRLQLHSGFTFGDATAIVPYLADLGITHVYASPYFKAKPGSTHGYDVTDHCRLNPELGSQADFDTLVATLKSHGMHHILDMVPNHVGIGNNDNVWWNDVLENGPASVYAKYFDINWTGSPSEDLNNRVLLPILGDLYAKALEEGHLKLLFEDGAFFLRVNDRKLPLSPRTFPIILRRAERQELLPIIVACDQLADRCDTREAVVERHASKEKIKRSLAGMKYSHAAIRQAMETINGVLGSPQSFDQLDEILRQQCFRLAQWRSAPDEINYRRFFDINDLAGVAIELPEVFEATHKLVLNLLAEDKVAGLRIDHPDGLRDPKQYFERLQSHYILAIAKTLANERGIEWKPLEADISRRIKSNQKPLYVAVEKILALDEPLIESWPVSGTTGYDFLNYVNGLFVDSTAEQKFTELYRDWIGTDRTCADLIYEKKKLILQISLASELNVLAITLKRIAEQDRYGLDFSLRTLHRGLKEIIACFPVYRSYITESDFTETDRRQIQHAVNAAIQRNPQLPKEPFDYIHRVLTDDAANESRAARRHLAAKFQQLTAPVTAKGIEDTTFYIYNRLLSLNEVGGDPSHFGITPDQLHEFFADRQKQWPRALSALSTHDTKRSEDVRARLNVLSEIPDEWQSHLHRWREMTDRFVQAGAPDANEQYAIYQTLLGAWPFDEQGLPEFEKRVQACMVKSMREAKVHTRWTDVNASHEEAVASFIHALLTHEAAELFRQDFRSFQKNISRVGIVNSLAQTLLKLTAPGIPDTYQGTELWDLSLVDPDNRRAVDYSTRAKVVNDDSSIARLFETPDGGRVKLAVMRVALMLRKSHPDLFERGSYMPLHVTGVHAEKVFAFARVLGDQAAIVAVPRLVSGLMSDDTNWPIDSAWKNTLLAVPNDLQRVNFQNLITDAACQSFDMAQLFGRVPLALLITK